MLAASTQEVLYTTWSGPAFAGVGRSSTRMFTVSREGGQEPLVMVQTKRLLPMLMPVTSDEAEVGELTVPDPETTVHNPVPTVGTLAVMVVLEPRQITWLVPAFDWVGCGSTVMTTVSTDGGQVPLVMVQMNLLGPMDKPFTDEEEEPALDIEPVPETSDQRPVPMVGIFPLNVAEEEHTDWSIPALAVVGRAST